MPTWISSLHFVPIAMTLLGSISNSAATLCLSIIGGDESETLLLRGVKIYFDFVRVKSSTVISPQSFAADLNQIH